MLTVIVTAVALGWKKNSPASCPANWIGAYSGFWINEVSAAASASDDETSRNRR